MRAQTQDDFAVHSVISDLEACPGLPPTRTLWHCSDATIDPPPSKRATECAQPAWGCPESRSLLQAVFSASPPPHGCLPTAPPRRCVDPWTCSFSGHRACWSGPPPGTCAAIFRRLSRHGWLVRKLGAHTARSGTQGGVPAWLPRNPRGVQGRHWGPVQVSQTVAPDRLPLLEASQWREVDRNSCWAG